MGEITVSPPPIDMCQLIIEYSRTRIVGNEQQMLAVVMAIATGYAPDASEFVSSFLEGESSSGKTAVQKAAFSVFPHGHIKDMTSASDKAPIYSNDLRIDPDTKQPYSDYVALRLAEYQKLSKPIVEILKSMSGDDPDFVYEVTNVVADNTREYHIRKMPYNCTYAQQEKDKELQTRLLLIPVEENIFINKAVILIQYGKERVTYNDREYYIHDDAELRKRIMDELDALMYYRPKVVCEFPDAFVDMVNHSRPESKRHALLISNLLHSSCRLNWKNRRCEGETLYVSAQDVVNVLSMFDLLQATMMGADSIDIAIYKHLRKNAGMSDMQLIHYLQSVGLTELTKVELQRRLTKLDNENYILSEHGERGIVWQANPSKQILTLRVDWELIMQHDGSVVVDPMSGIVYDNILEYARVVTEEYAIKSGQKFQNDLSEMESMIRGAIIEHLSRQNCNNSRNGVIHGAMRLVTSKDVGYFEVEEALGKLVAERHVIHDIPNECYRNRLNEVGLDTSEL